ncbi:hypothetical protein VP01_1038g12 [Puccinia sorghi]|uniref:Uncharacterized protein n=1 Tax=Puccinia sorghi TaxID=27349 RepID=A0A0L6VUG1_9BASI|nr:hypothetical protein VP01_1038g12 [Puccinia sorghi]
MMELMEETSGSAPQAGQEAGGSHQAEPVTQEEVVSLADMVKELGLFVQRSVGKDGPPADHFGQGGDSLGRGFSRRKGQDDHLSAVERELGGKGKEGAG